MTADEYTRVSVGEAIHGFLAGVALVVVLVVVGLAISNEPPPAWVMELWS